MRNQDRPGATSPKAEARSRTGSHCLGPRRCGIKTGQGQPLRRLRPTAEDGEPLSGAEDEESRPQGWRLGARPRTALLGIWFFFRQIERGLFLLIWFSDWKSGQKFNGQFIIWILLRIRFGRLSRNVNKFSRYFIKSVYWGSKGSIQERLECQQTWLFPIFDKFFRKRHF